MGWFSPGWLPLSDHPGQKTQRKILGFKPAQREAGFARPTDSSDRNNKQEYLTGNVAPILSFLVFRRGTNDKGSNRAVL